MFDWSFGGKVATKRPTYSVQGSEKGKKRVRTKSCNLLIPTPPPPLTSIYIVGDHLPDP